MLLLAVSHQCLGYCTPAPPPHPHIYLPEPHLLPGCLSSTHGAFEVNYCCADMLLICCNNTFLQQADTGPVDAPVRLVRRDEDHHCSCKAGLVNETQTTQIPRSMLWATDVYLSLFLQVGPPPPVAAFLFVENIFRYSSALHQQANKLY